MSNNRPNLTPELIKSMKRTAWQDKKERNCSHAHALNRVAQENGYESWASLMQDYNTKTVVS